MKDDEKVDVMVSKKVKLLVGKKGHMKVELMVAWRAASRDGRSAFVMAASLVSTTVDSKVGGKVVTKVSL